MSINSTIAERVGAAAYTGKEAKFLDGVTEREFTPDGIKDYIENNGLDTINSIDIVDLEYYGTDGAALVSALATGKAVAIGRSVTSISLSTTQSLSALPYLSRLLTLGPLTLSLASGVHTFTTGDISAFSAANHNVTIVGADPIVLTMTSVASVTGSTGNYSVTYNVSDSTGVAVGDILKNFEIGPIPILNGDNAASYVLRRRPLANELYNPLVNLGAITAAAGAGSATFAGGIDTTANCLVVGDLLTVAGQTRPIASIAAGSCTITGTWDVLGATSESLYFVTKPNTGTVTVVGTAVTGSGTLFLTEANVGDMMLIDGCLIKIASITNDTSLTLSVSHTVGAGTVFSIITNGVLHDGAHLVTAVGAGTVTVTNRSVVAPPVNKVVGGSMHSIKTVLYQSGTGDGLKFDQSGSIKWIDKVALRGPRSGAPVGIAMNGRVATSPLAIDGSTSFGSITQHGYVSEMICGPDFAVLDFAYNVFVGHGCNFQARMGAFSGGTVVNVWLMEQGFANLRRAVLSGSSSHGLLINSGSTVLATEIRLVGNTSDGCRVQSGSTIYGEAPMAVANGVMNYRMTGRGSVNLSQGVSLLGGSRGFYHSGGGSSELSLFVISANSGTGLDMIGLGRTIGTGNWITGNTSNGINCNRGQVDSQSSWVTGNTNIGAYSYSGGSIDISSSFVTGNVAANIRADTGSFISIASGYSPTLAVTGAFSSINRTSTINTPTLSGVGRINEYTKDGAIIYDGSSSTGWNVTGLRPNAGSNLTFIGRSVAAQDCLSVPAKSQLALPADITITGATTTGMGVIVNSNTVDADLSYTGKIVAADTVRVYVQNWSAGAIDPANATYTVTVYGTAA